MANGPGEIAVRKIQLTGGATYTVSLPKPWIDKMKLNPRDGIRVDWRPSGALRLTPMEMIQNTERVVSINFSQIPSESLHDHLMGAYIAGADSIRILHDSNGDKSLHKQIRRFLKNTRGFELMNDSEGIIDLISLIGGAEMPLNASINRMYSLLTSVTRDIISISEGTEVDLLSDVDDRESEVDALLYLVERQVSVALESHFVASSLKLARNQAVEHSNLATSLERMMDHATQMAHLIQSSTELHLNKDKTPILQIYMWQDAMKKLMINIRTRNSFEIEESRQKLKKAQLQITAYEDKLFQGRKMTKSDMLLFRLSESVRRLCAYARDFGEILLNLKLHDEMISRKR